MVGVSIRFPLPEWPISYLMKHFARSCPVIHSVAVAGYIKRRDKPDFRPSSTVLKIGSVFVHPSVFDSIRIQNSTWQGRFVGHCCVSSATRFGATIIQKKFNSNRICLVAFDKVDLHMRTLERALHHVPFRTGFC